MVDRGEIKAFISGLAFDTIIYVLDMCFKKNGMSKSLREQTIRRTLNIILDKFIVVEISNDILRQAINDTNFV